MLSLPKKHPRQTFYKTQTHFWARRPQGASIGYDNFSFNPSICRTRRTFRCNRNTFIFKAHISRRVSEKSHWLSSCTFLAQMCLETSVAYPLPLSLAIDLGRLVHSVLPPVTFTGLCFGSIKSVKSIEPPSHFFSWKALFLAWAWTQTLTHLHWEKAGGQTPTSRYPWIPHPAVFISLARVTAFLGKFGKRKRFLSVT